MILIINSIGIINGFLTTTHFNNNNIIKHNYSKNIEPDKLSSLSIVYRMYLFIIELKFNKLITVKHLTPSYCKYSRMGPCTFPPFLHYHCIVSRFPYGLKKLKTFKIYI